jgi:hypothetical protein
VVSENFIKLALRASTHLPQDVKRKTLAALWSLFESWASQLDSSNITYAADGGLSSFNFSQSGGNSEHIAPNNSRGQKRPGDEDDEQPPNDGDRNPRKRQNIYGILNAERRPNWACPFYQREPGRYCEKTELGDFRKCAKSPGFSELHRIKSVYQTSLWSILKYY